jgi:integrase
VKETNWKTLTVAKATARMIRIRAAQVSPSTKLAWKWAGRQLAAYFKNKPLSRLGPDDLGQYQFHRQEQGKAPGTINAEVSILRLLLKRAQLWAKFSDFYHPIPNTKTPPGRAISDDEVAMLLSVAASKRGWADFHDALVLSFFMGLRSGEIRHLRWKEVDLLNRSLSVRHGKTKAAQRMMILNDKAFDTLTRRFSKAVAVQRHQPEHYLFHWLGRGGSDPDPTRPRQAFRMTFAKIAKAAGLPGLRLHDGRHTAITTLLEAGVPEWVVRAHAGHVDPRMMATYSHIRREALTKAAAVLDRKPPVIESEEPSADHRIVEVRRKRR